MSSVLLADPPGPRRPSFEAGHQDPYPAGYTTPPPEGRSPCVAFPSPFGAPAFACWTILFPPRNSASLTVGLPGATRRHRTATGFPRCTRMRPDRDGRPLDPGAMVSTRRQRNVPAGIRRFPAASPTPPPHQPVTGAHSHEASTKVHPIRPSDLPLARGHPECAGTLRLSPGLRTPPSPATHARTRTGHRTLARDHGLDISRPSYRRHPLTACALVSHPHPAGFPQWWR